MKLFKKKDLVGIDIGASAIKMIQLKKIQKRNSKQYELINLAYSKLPPDTIKENKFIKPEIVAEIIRNTFQEKKFEIKNVATSISGRSVIVKKIRLPKMIEEELEDTIQWEAEQFIPFDINDVSLDFQIMPQKDSQDDEMDVLLVAVKNERISDIVNILELAELNPVIVDIDAFALENIFEINYNPDPNSYIALIDIGAETMCLNILQGNSSVFTRDASIGINQFQRTMQKEMLLNFDQSNELVKDMEFDSMSREDILSYLDGFLEELLAEIQRSFDYFKATVTYEDINQIYLSGGGVMMKDLLEFLKDRLGIPIQILDPFKKIHINPKKFNLEYIYSLSPMMNIGMGLALRRVGDR